MELEPLFLPLDATQPCGVDMSFSPEFDRIQEARRADDPLLSQGEWVTELKEADWPAVVSGCSILLATRTKDLRVAVWLAEGLAKTRGLAGLADGYILIARLCEQYWEHIHPLPDDGDLSLRAGCLGWLLAQSPRIIRELPLTDSAEGVHSSIDLDAARAQAQAVDRNPTETDALSRAGRVSLGRFDTARAQTPDAFYHDSLQAANAVFEALNVLEPVVDSRLGDEGPRFGPARTALAAMIDHLRRLAGAAAGDIPPVYHAQPNPVTVSSAPAATMGQCHARTIHSRQQALDQLRQVAEFFRHTEPHSPVAYLADKAAHWGEMPLHEWLRAVVSDDATLARVEELLGVDLNR